MCGICGVLGVANAQDRVAKMVAAMHHRGPDDKGEWARGPHALGMTRLAFQDLSSAGHQPMASPDETVWLVYNGEMYNAPEERRGLEELGYRFRSTSDTEVILTLYRHYGADCLPRIRGIFALGIVDLRDDADNPTILLARDPLGVKPLLFHRDENGGVVFASELKAMLASGMITPRIEPRALRCLLENGSIYQPETLLQGITMVPPAHKVTIRDGRIDTARYWSLGTDRVAGLRSADYGEQIQVMGDALRETVRAQLIGDVPIGAFLSGGVDSATLVALMAAEIGQKVRTFSVGFDESLRVIDETGLAGQFASHLGTDHTRIQIGPQMIRDEIDSIVDAIDQPSIDGLNTYFVSKVTGRSVKAAISGTGGDDLFMGYPWHAHMLRRTDQGTNFLTEYAAAAGQFHQTFAATDADQLIAPALASESARDRLADYAAIDELGQCETVDRITALTLRGYTNNQLLRDIDAMSMAHSLEVRVPYLDPVIIDLGLSLPATAKLANPHPDATMRQSYRASGIKRILIDVARPLLPAGFDEVPKRGFGIPFGPWLNGPLRDMVIDVLKPGRVEKTGVLNPLAMARLQRLLADGKEVSGWRLWLMMTTQIWSERMGIEPAA